MKRRHVVGISCLTYFASVFFPSISCAFKQADLDKLLATRECRWCDLHNADLAKTGLSGAQLSGANLLKACFRKANLTGAERKDANMAGADLSGATWTDGTKCDEGSIKECKHGSSNRAGGRNRSLSPPVPR